MLRWLKKRFKSSDRLQVPIREIKWYPNCNSCIKQDMSSVQPQQMPPLMVRKAAWRR